MMTLRSLAVRSLLFSAVSAHLLVAASAARLHYYEDLLKQATTFCKQAAKAPPVVVSEDDPKSRAAPQGHAVSLVVLSKSGKLLRISYFRSGTLIAIEHLGAGATVVRRDVYQGKKIRVQQFFDEEHNLSQVTFLDVQGKVVHRKQLPVAAPFPGWVYG